MDWFTDRKKGKLILLVAFIINLVNLIYEVLKPANPSNPLEPLDRIMGTPLKLAITILLGIGYVYLCVYEKKQSSQKTE